MGFICLQSILWPFIVYFHWSDKFQSKRLSSCQVSRKQLLSICNFVWLAMQDIAYNFVHHTRRHVYNINCRRTVVALLTDLYQKSYSNTIPQERHTSRAFVSHAICGAHACLLIHFHSMPLTEPSTDTFWNFFIMLNSFSFLPLSLDCI